MGAKWRLLVLCLLAALAAPAASQGGLDVEATASCAWDKADLEVAVLPPTSPIIANNAAWENYIPGDLDGFSEQLEGLEVLPEGASAPWEGAYVRATFAAVEAWEATMHAYAADHPDASHLADVTLTPFLVNENDVDRLANADVLIAFLPTLPGALGQTTNACQPIAGECLIVLANTDDCQYIVGTAIVMSQWYIYSFSEADMYNVILHEFGHALGLDHVAFAPDAMDGSGYPYGVGNPTTPLWCVSNLNMEQLSVSFAWLDGAPFRSPPPGVTMPIADYELYC